MTSLSSFVIRLWIYQSYEGANGQLDLTAREIKERNDFFTRTYFSEVYGEQFKATDCSSLEDIFDGNVLIEDLINGDRRYVEGSLNKSSDRVMWWMHPLKLGSVDGRRVGYTNGVCILLPTATQFACDVEMYFDNYGYITVSGLSPNSFDTGVMAITGATGCFQRVGGTLSLTAQNITTPYDAYAWGIVSSTEEEENGKKEDNNDTQGSAAFRLLNLTVTVNFIFLIMTFVQLSSF